MKRLLIMRHAKSAWPDGVDDHDRPLNKRGNRAAPKMAHLLLQKGFSPDAAIVSSARRTQETWQQMNAVFLQNNITIAMETEPNFYLAGLGAIQRKLSERTDVLLALVAVGRLDRRAQGPLRVRDARRQSDGAEDLSLIHI